jgi:ligand-binding SRPBCC domain-containing protein
MPEFENETIFPCSCEGLFQFFTRPENISDVSDPDLGLKFVDAPEVLHSGADLKFQLVSFGQVHTMKHQVSEFDSPNLVIETQLDGPMKSWKHSHIYTAHDGGCKKTDRIEFDPPGGMIGFFLTEAKIVDQLEDGMYARDQKLNELIERGVIK